MTTTQARSPVASLALVRAALRHPDLTDRQRVVLAELASHDPAGFVPTVGVLARTLWGTDDRRHRDHVRKMLRALEDRGVLEVEYEDNGEAKRDARVRCYNLVLDDADSASLPKKLSKPTKSGTSTPTASDAGSASPRKTLSKVTPGERRVTLAQRQSDAGSTGLRASKNKSKDTKSKKKESDAQSASPTKMPKKAPKAKKGKGKPSSANKKSPNSKKVLKLLRNSERGMLTIDVAKSLGKPTIGLQDELRKMESLGLLNNTAKRGMPERWKEAG